MSNESRPNSVLTHGDDDWQYLTRYAQYQPPSGWVTEMNAGCYYSLTWGTKLAIQYRVPAIDDVKHWTGHRLASIQAKDRPAVIDETNRYLSFLMDPKLSPWRSVCHAFEVIRNKDGHPTGLLCDNAKDINRAMTHNFCIAVRAAWELNPNIRRWAQLCDLGIDPVAALYYAMYTSQLQGGTVAFASHLSHTWTTFMNAQSAVPSLAYLDLPPVERLNQEMFSKKGPRLPNSNFIWMIAGNPRSVSLGKEFPSKAVIQKRMPYSSLYNLTIKEEDFLANMKKAAKARRKMELKHISKEKD